MKNPFSSRDLSDATRRRVELAVAVAQERLLSTHVRHALKLIQLVGDQVPFENALGIYTRLLRLSEDESRVITTRALATLGERAARSDVWPELVTEEEDPQDPERPGLFSLMEAMRQRLRGRVKDELRRWVELAAARTEVAILNAHVDNALSFVELLEKEMPLTDAVELYLDALDVRESIGEVTYYLALARLAETRLPGDRNGPPTGEPTEANRPLRVVDRDSR